MSGNIESIAWIVAECYVTWGLKGDTTEPADKKRKKNISHLLKYLTSAVVDQRKSTV